MYYVYILYSEKFNRYYVGQTDNVKLRLIRHNNSEVKSTKHYIPWKLFYTEAYASRSEALRREHFLKRQRNKEFYKKLAQSAESRLLGINH